MILFAMFEHTIQTNNYAAFYIFRYSLIFISADKINTIAIFFILFTFFSIVFNHIFYLHHLRFEMKKISWQIFIKQQ